MLISPHRVVRAVGIQEARRLVAEDGKLPELRTLVQMGKVAEDQDALALPSDTVTSAKAVEQALQSDPQTDPRIVWRNTRILSKQFQLDPEFLDRQWQHVVDLAGKQLTAAERIDLGAKLLSSGTNRSYLQREKVWDMMTDSAYQSLGPDNGSVAYRKEANKQLDLLTGALENRTFDLSEVLLRFAEKTEAQSGLVTDINNKLEKAEREVVGDKRTDRRIAGAELALDLLTQRGHLSAITGHWEKLWL